MHREARPHACINTIRFPDLLGCRRLHFECNAAVALVVDRDGAEELLVQGESKLELGGRDFNILHLIQKCYLSVLPMAMGIAILPRVPTREPPRPQAAALAQRSVRSSSHRWAPPAGSTVYILAIEL